MEGKQRVMLGSNNYLGLTGDERVKQGALDALNQYGTGLTGSRFLNGTIELHLELERELADWLGTEAALVSRPATRPTWARSARSSVQATPSIADSGDHASILDGCILSRAKLRPFRHNRIDRLERTLEKAQDDGGGILVVVDGVFSMEGDVAPLPRDRGTLRPLRRKVDGRRGACPRRPREREEPGRAELLGVEDRVDLRMATFSKSLASCGGVIAGPADVIEFLRIQSRPFMFTASGCAGCRRSRARRGPDLPLGRGPRAVREGTRQRPLPAHRPARARATG